MSDTSGTPGPGLPVMPTAPSDRRAEWTFPEDPGSVRAARAAVRSTLNAWRLNAVTDLTVLLVSELVTNVLRHAGGPIGVRVRRTRKEALLVEVSDSRPDLPLARDARPDEEGGRGLQLVARTSRRWGTLSGPDGKTVWFELALPG